MSVRHAVRWHAAIAAGLSGVLAALVWADSGGGHARFLDFFSGLIAPALLMVGAVTVLAMYHRSVPLALAGSLALPVTVFVSEVVASTLFEGPAEEIGPFWQLVIVMILGVLPTVIVGALCSGTVAWFRGRADRRRRRGLCASCGYPLVGLAVPICPECGRSV